MANGSTIQELTDILSKLRDRQAALQHELAEISRRVGVIQETIGIYREHHDLPIPTAVTLEMLEIQGRRTSLEERRRNALRQFAHLNGDRLIVAKANAPMVEAGLFKSAKQYREQIYNLIGRMECWEHVGRGIYRLVDSSTPRQA